MGASGGLRLSPHERKTRVYRCDEGLTFVGWRIIQGRMRHVRAHHAPLGKSHRIGAISVMKTVSQSASSERSQIVLRVQASYTALCEDSVYMAVPSSCGALAFHRLGHSGPVRSSSNPTGIRFQPFSHLIGLLMDNCGVDPQPPRLLVDRRRGLSRFLVHRVNIEHHLAITPATQLVEVRDRVRYLMIRESHLA